MDKKRSVSMGIFGLLAGAGLGLYGSRTKLYAQWLDLPPAHYKVKTETGIPIQMADGVILSADHYAPRTRGAFPTILIRSPYGRGTDIGVAGRVLSFVFERFAERGFHVLAQTARGRGDSEGTFHPFEDEAEDGLATVQWLKDQPWFNGVLGTWGTSYLGYAQWAIAAEAGPVLRAIVPAVTTAGFTIYPDEVFSLETALNWVNTLDIMENTKGSGLNTVRNLQFANRAKAVKPFINVLPLRKLDEAITGKSAPFYQNWIDHSQSDDPYWDKFDKRRTIPAVLAEAHIIGGWYDFLIREQLKDYAAMKASGATPYLTIGPWTHFSQDLYMTAIKEGIQWFEAKLNRNRYHLRPKPVRIYVMGANEWRDFDNWPPPAVETPYYLHPKAVLSPAACTIEAADPTTYTYNPADPTPAVGGARYDFGVIGAVDNRTLEARDDVITFTTPPLKEDLEIIGPVRLVLHVQSSLPYTDFFGRLCDVSPKGRSENICDGLFHIVNQSPNPSDDCLEITVDMWSTAYRFVKGNRVRVQVSSGAHPRWNRNYGTGEPFADATTMLAANQAVFHDAAHPSRLLLPVIDPA